MVLISFIACLLGFVGIGVLAILKRQKHQYDYLLSSQDVRPWLAALSAVATNNSGYMFVGQIGFTYLYGLSSIWLMFGFILGDLVTSFIVHKKLREAAQDNKQLSFAGVISTWFGQDYIWLRRIGGVVTLLFLGTYAAAQLSAGSKALYVLLGWPYEVGAIVGAGIVLVYCFSGGIRASIWTDAAQSFVMIIAMLVMLVVSLSVIGGMDAFYQKLQYVSPTYMDWFSPETHSLGSVGPFLFAFGWFFAGMGVIGQPQVMVRFMAMDDPKNMAKVRLYYYSWYTLFFACTILVAMAARLILPEAMGAGIEGFDAELALPALAQHLLHPLVVGLILAGLFAATMSTADSQILACTAAITHDFSKKSLQGYAIVKLITVFVTLFALGIALFAKTSVFVLVLLGWSTLASAFGPLLVAYALGLKPTEGISILGMVTGCSMVLVWRFFGLTPYVHDIVPGMFSAFLVLFVGCWWVRRG